MNNTQTNEILPMSKKDRRCRAVRYQHFKTVKKKIYYVAKKPMPLARAAKEGRK